MFRALSVAKSSLQAQQATISVISNNVANVSTTGFKRQRMVFGELLYQTLRQPGAQSSQQTTIPTGLQLGTGVKPVATERLHTQGNLTQTTNSKDIAIQGRGFFTVQLPEGGTAYTRDGSFQIDQHGQLVTANGYPIQPAVIIPPEAQTMTVAEDGTVSVTISGQTEPQQIAQLALSQFINESGLESLGDNLYQETQASGVPNESSPGLNGAGYLKQGFVESSNVNVSEELVNMIQAHRVFEISSKVLETTDQMLRCLTQRL